MDAGRRKAVGRQEAVEIGDAAAADDGERAVQLPGKAGQLPLGSGLHRHGLRIVDELDQRPVEVQKDGVTGRVEGGGECGFLYHLGCST